MLSKVTVNNHCFAVNSIADEFACTRVHSESKIQFTLPRRHVVSLQKTQVVREPSSGAV